MRFVRAALSLPGLRLAVVSQEPITRLPDDIRERLAAFARVSNALDADELVTGVREVANTMGGPPHSLIGILEQAQVPLADARARLGLPGTSPAAARNFRDKARMKDILREHGLPCARHALARSTQDAAAAAARFGYPVVVKPPAGAGAKATVRVADRAQLEQHLATQQPSASSPVLVEEFIKGREFSFDTITLAGRHLFHSVNSYSPTPLEVVQTPWIQWCVLLPREQRMPAFDAIWDAGPRALDALGMHTGMSHMEWFLRSDGSIAISEVAARPPGAQFMTLLSWAHDCDFYRAWAELVTFGRVAIPPRRFATGAAYLRAQGDGGKITAVAGLEQVREELGELVVEVKPPESGQSPTGTYEGEGYVIVRHEDTRVVQRALERIVDLVRVRLG
ncbi:MAG: ATP-grasp domain-containing protein [Planctomycetes bacterium]|nr:ATP-grasp domain-containing protein [Planctomycetota bacterium]